MPCCNRLSARPERVKRLASWAKKLIKTPEKSRTSVTRGQPKRKEYSLNFPRPADQFRLASLILIRPTVRACDGPNRAADGICRAAGAQPGPSVRLHRDVTAESGRCRRSFSANEPRAVEEVGAIRSRSGFCPLGLRHGPLRG